MYVLAGEFAKGRCLLDRAAAAGPIRPRWFSHGYYLDRFHQGNYQGALDTVNLVDETELWQPVLLSAALGKLGRSEQATEANAKLLEWKPDFGGRARELIQRSVKTPGLVDDLLDGLRKAGVAIADD